MSYKNQWYLKNRLAVLMYQQLCRLDSGGKLWEPVSPERARLARLMYGQLLRQIPDLRDKRNAQVRDRYQRLFSRKLFRWGDGNCLKNFSPEERYLYYGIGQELKRRGRRERERYGMPKWGYERKPKISWDRKYGGLQSSFTKEEKFIYDSLGYHFKKKNAPWIEKKRLQARSRQKLLLSSVEGKKKYFRLQKNWRSKNKPLLQRRYFQKKYGEFAAAALINNEIKEYCRQKIKQPVGRNEDM